MSAVSLFHVGAAVWIHGLHCHSCFVEAIKQAVLDLLLLSHYQSLTECSKFNII